MSGLAETAARQRPAASEKDEQFNPCELECGACGKRGRYRTGDILVDLDLIGKDDERAYAFAGIFSCRRCGADGPWKPTNGTRMNIVANLITKSGRVFAGRIALFDGTTVLTGTQAVRHVRSRIEAD